MEYRSLGRTGVPVSVIALGSMNFGRETPEAESLRIIDRAIDGGINFIDTANVYSRGVSEQIIAQALKGKRDRIVLATKVHGRMSDDDPLAYGNSRRHIIEQCEASLRRLGTDHIDLYQIHRPQSDMAIDETLRALDDLIRSGKVRYVGSSSFAAWQVVESLWVAKELGLNRFVTDRTIERELIPMAQTYGIGILPWSPLARGFLSGKYRRTEGIPEGSRLARDAGKPGFFGPRTQQHFTEEAFAVQDVVDAIAEEKGCTAAQVAIAWLIHQPGVTSPIVGPRTVEHLEDNLGAVEVTITPEDCARLDAVVAPEHAIAEYYNGEAMDFGPSQYRW
jgi:aryl-alcohol dehydrogenase-like predicted oxidoreductase